MYITKEELLTKINSYDILNYYLQPYHNNGNLIAGKNISNPFLGKKQETPSFNIFCALPNNQWEFKDFATDDKGSCFDFVMRLFNLSFPDAITKIANDFGIDSYSTPKKQISQTMKTEILVEPNKSFELTEKAFSNAELSFWMKYKISIDTLNRYNVVAVDEFSTQTKEGNAYTVKSSPDKFIFGYKNGIAYKIYKPLDEKQYRFQHLGNKEANFIFGWVQLPATGNCLFITGGEKDVMSLAAHGFNAISLNSETASLSKDIAQQLKQRFKKVIVMYDTDETGVKQSKKLADEHNFLKLDIPLQENLGKDISDFFKLGLTANQLNLILKDNFPSIINNKLKNFDDLAIEGEKIKALRKVFGNFILENSTVLFPSERGVGKTFFMLQLAISVAFGKESFCGEPLEVQGNVLYINFELGENTFKKRIANLYRSIPKEHRKYAPFCLSYRGNLMQHLDEIIEAIETIKPVLVIIDNLRAAFSDKDNEKNKEMVKAIMDLNALKDQYLFSFVIVHHTKKGTSDKLTDSDLQSGAGGITDIVDADFFMRKSKLNKLFRVLKRVKSRECEEQDGAKLIQLNPDTMWFEFIEDNIDEAEHIFCSSGKSKDEKRNIAMQMRNEGKSLNEIASEFGVHKSSVSRWLPD